MLSPLVGVEFHSATHRRVTPGPVGIQFLLSGEIANDPGRRGCASARVTFQFEGDLREVTDD